MTTYNELNGLGQCIIDKKLEQLAPTLQARLRDFAADGIDRSLWHSGKNPDDYETAVTTCIRKFNPPLPLTPPSVRKTQGR